MQPPSPHFEHFWRSCQTGILADVILGSPKSQNCKDFGICRIALELGAYQQICHNRALAYFRIDPPTSRLLVHFLSCSIDTECAAYFFRAGTFRMDEDYELPQDVAQALAMDKNAPSFRIEKGSYPALIDDHFHTVSLRLAQAVGATALARRAA